MNPFRVSQEQISAFEQDGYLLVPRMFDEEEMNLLITIAKSDRDMDKAAARRDAQGGVSRLRLRNELYDDIYSAFVRCSRIVGTMETLLTDEVYHFHHKMML